MEHDGDGAYNSGLCPDPTCFISPDARSLLKFVLPVLVRRDLRLHLSVIFRGGTKLEDPSCKRMDLRHDID